MMAMPSKDVHIEINKEQMLSCVVTLTKAYVYYTFTDPKYSATRSELK